MQIQYYIFVFERNEMANYRKAIRLAGTNDDMFIPAEAPKAYLLPDTPLKGVEEPALQYGHASQVFHFLGYNQGDMADMLEVDPSTLSRWKKRDMPVGKLRSRILIEMDHIIAKGVRIFGSEEAFQLWMQTTNYALGDQTPLEALKSPEGISLLENTLEALSWGNIS